MPPLSPPSPTTQGESVAEETALTLVPYEDQLPLPPPSPTTGVPGSPTAAGEHKHHMLRKHQPDSHHLPNHETPTAPGKAPCTTRDTNQLEHPPYNDINEIQPRTPPASL